MQRHVRAELDLELGSSVDLILQIALARSAGVVSEQLSLLQDGREVRPRELVDASGNRLHRVTGEAGRLRLRYEAVVGAATAPPTTEIDTIAALRPSRYAPSDEVFATARRLFRGLAGRELVAAVSDFVATSVTYTPGMSLGTDSAVTTLASGQGVCRDYAHLVIALLRAMDMPARYVACYAPALDPMDFHAVAEVFVEGQWSVVDATRLAPRSSLVRIATGRDAADCAFLSYHGGYVGLERLEVGAIVQDQPVPDDDHTALVPMS